MTQPGCPLSWLPRPLAQARTEAQILGGDCSHLPFSPFWGRMAEETSHHLSTNCFQLENARLTDTQRGCLEQSDFRGGRQGTSQRWLRSTWRAGHRGQQSNVEPVAEGPLVSPQCQCDHHRLHSRRCPPLSSHSALAARKHTGHRPLQVQWAEAWTCPEAVVTFKSPAGRRTGPGRSPEAGSEVAATFGSEDAGWAPGLHRPESQFAAALFHLLFPS